MVESENIQLEEQESEANDLSLEETTARNLHDSQSEKNDTDDKIKKEESGSESTPDLKEELEKVSKPEEKLKSTIELMETSLAQSGSPDFKTFWESRKSALELFKENIPPVVKALFWTKYRELTKEAKRLKEIFEEQTAFAVEQIEIAIQALENDINDFDLQLENVAYPDFPKGLSVLKDRLSTYREKQKELNLLNTQAARINALRKELVRTEMRIRQKNKFFQRLSVSGDRVFPKRKELIKEIRQFFIDDINMYVKSRFTTLANEKSLHQLREEIMALQALAKIMTLNTNAFTHSRLKLGECWDKLKSLDKERKKEHAQQKLTYKENAEEVKVKIDEFSEAVHGNQMSTGEAQTKSDEISKFMRTKDLGKEEVKALKDQLNQAFKPVKEKLIEEEKKRREIELEKEQDRQNKIRSIEERLSKLSKLQETAQFEEIVKGIEAIDLEISNLCLSDSERDVLMGQLVPVRDSIKEQEEQEVLALSNDDPEKISKLKASIKIASARKNDIKEQLEKYRKAAGGSGLDFEQSMFYNEQLNIEKRRLEKVNSNIAKLEACMAELKG